jgi:hypothetical protein
MQAKCANEYLLTQSVNGNTVPGIPLAAGSNDWDTNWFEVSNFPWVSISAGFIGPNQPTGTLTLYGSNDFDNGSQQGTLPKSAWDQLAVGAAKTVTAGTLVYAWDIVTGYRWLRVVYTHTANVAGMTAMCSYSAKAGI